MHSFEFAIDKNQKDLIYIYKETAEYPESKLIILTNYDKTLRGVSKRFAKKEEKNKTAVKINIIRTGATMTKEEFSQFMNNKNQTQLLYSKDE